MVMCQTKFLRKLFSGCGICGEEAHILLPSVLRSELKVIIHFLYTGELNVPTKTMIHNVGSILTETLGFPAQIPFNQESGPALSMACPMTDCDQEVAVHVMLEHFDNDVTEEVNANKDRVFTNMNVLCRFCRNSINYIGRSNPLNTIKEHYAEHKEDLINYLKIEVQLPPFSTRSHTYIHVSHIFCTLFQHGIDETTNEEDAALEDSINNNEVMETSFQGGDPEDDATCFTSITATSIPLKAFNKTGNSGGDDAIFSESSSCGELFSNDDEFGLEAHISHSVVNSDEGGEKRKKKKKRKKRKLTSAGANGDDCTPRAAKKRRKSQPASTTLTGKKTRAKFQCKICCEGISWTGRLLHTVTHVTLTEQSKPIQDRDGEKLWCCPMCTVKRKSHHGIKIHVVQEHRLLEPFLKSRGYTSLDESYESTPIGGLSGQPMTESAFDSTIPPPPPPSANYDVDPNAETE
jgi:uncharacterized C2H2 Zn-finger protein